MPIPKPLDALQLVFHEALGFFQGRDIVSPDAWAKLDDKARKRALTVAGVARLNVLSDTWRALERAIAKGTDFRTFQAEIGPALTRTWGGSVAAPNWRLETIFRNNVQAAYSAGRYEVTMNPDVAQLRPFRMFDAILDSRTSAVCQACDGTVLPVTDPWWRGHLPPCHHACRSGFISLSPRQADKRGVSKKPPVVPAADGFGGLPSLGPVLPSKATPPELASAHLGSSGGAAPPSGPPAGGGGGSDGGGSGKPPGGPAGGSGGGKPPGGHPPPESGKHGGSWEPGQRRSFLYSVGKIDERRPPWHLGAEDRAPGRDFEALDHGAALDRDALPAARLIRAQGNDLYPLRIARDAAGQAVKGADATFNFEPPASRLPPFPPSAVPVHALGDFKRLKPTGRASSFNNILKTLRKSARNGGQARNIVIDGTQSGLSLLDARWLAGRVDQDPELRRMLDFVRFIGHDFDLSIQIQAPE